MRQSLLTIIFSLFLIALVACNSEDVDSNTDSKAENDDTTEESTQEDNGDSVMDIYEKAIAAQEDIESAEIEVELDQAIDFEDETMETSSTFTILMTTDPFAMHQKGTTSMAFGPDDVEEMDIEMYMTDEDMYFYEGFSGQWMNIGSEMSELLGELGSLDDQQDPYEQLKMFEDHIEHFSIDTSNDEYILSLTLDAESFDETFKAIIEDTMSDNLVMIFEEAGDFDPFEHMDINALAYKITLDKETLQLKGYDMQMDMTITEDGESATISQEVRSVYSNINGVDPIEIPQDVIDEAVSGF